MSNMDFSPYGTLKRLGEEVTKSLNAVYVKFWNVYGVENDIEKSHVVTDFVLKALKKKHINMLTDGKESREFLFADDCSEGLFIIMNKFKFFSKKDKELHLTTGKRIKIIKIAKIIQKLLLQRNIKVKISQSKKNGTYHKQLLQNQTNGKHISWEAGICEWSTRF